MISVEDLERDAELLRKDKRVKEVVVEGNIVTVHTHDFLVTSPHTKSKRHIGELVFEIVLGREMANRGLYDFGGRLKARNLSQPFGYGWITPMMYSGQANTVAACWGGYHSAMSSALDKGDLLTFVEELFRFNSSFDNNVAHGEYAFGF